MEKRKRSERVLLVLICVLAVYAMMSLKPQVMKVEKYKGFFNRKMILTAKTFFYPQSEFRERQFSIMKIIEKKAEEFIPVWTYCTEDKMWTGGPEDEETYETILEKQAVSEDNENINPEVSADTAASSAVDTSLEKLRDFEYLTSHFYTVDSGTVLYPEDFDVEEMISRDFSVDTSTKGPKVLIFHTHSQEAFIDSTPGDPETSIVGIGAYLSELLNAQGINTLHHKGVYDLINGELDRGHAYELAEKDVKDILETYPSIEVVIDLHRDGVKDSTHLLMEGAEKPTAQIMFFNGISRSRINGDIAYLPNPYIKDNLAFSLQMELNASKKYPGLTRRIYVREYRYILHLKPRSTLIEAGAQTNTVEEMKNAMELLSHIISDVLKPN